MYRSNVTLTLEKQAFDGLLKSSRAAGELILSRARIVPQGRYLSVLWEDVRWQAGLPDVDAITDYLNLRRIPYLPSLQGEFDGDCEEIGAYVTDKLRAANEEAPFSSPSP